jgi:uncharacterized membrane protein
LAGDFGDYLQEKQMGYLATGGIMSTASAAAAIASDPALPEVVQLVLKLKAIEGDKTSGSSSGGIGLRNVVGPLNTFVTIQERPWILPVAIVGIFGAVFAAGYFTSKLSKK